MCRGGPPSRTLSMSLPVTYITTYMSAYLLFIHDSRKLQFKVLSNHAYTFNFLKKMGRKNLML